MLKALLKKQLSEIFRGYFYDSKKNKARSKGAVIAYFTLFVVLMVGVLGGMFAFLAFALCAPLTQAGAGWLYFTILGLLAVFLGVFGSVFNTYAGMYLAKDNDLLLSMPIPVRVIMLARLLGVYLMGLLYSGVVMVPALIVYFAVAPFRPAALFGAIWLSFLISVFVLTLSVALGYVVAKISLKLKNKSFITVLVSLLFFAGYYFLYFKAQALITKLVENIGQYSEKIRGAAYLLYLFGRTGEGDPIAVLAVSAVILGLFALVWVLISRSFLKIATATGKSEKKKYKEGAAKQRGTSAALFRKEMGRFTSSPNYMLNCGLGGVFLLALGVVLLIRGGAIAEMLNGFLGEGSGFAPALLAAAVLALTAMNDMAAPSVSLEGKTIWLVQSLPVTPWQVLRAKLSVQLALTGVPALFCLLCAAIPRMMTAGEWLTFAALVLSGVLFQALFALMLGTKMPNLTWTSELTPIKQSAPVAISMLGGMFGSVVLAGLYFVFGAKIGFVGYALIFTVLLLAVSALLYRWLKKKGSAVFAAL